MNAIDPMTWSVLLVVLGCALVVLEIFIPSGGVLGFLAATSFVAAIVLAYVNYGAKVGTVFLLVSAVLLPTVMGLALKYWPDTPMGRRILLTPPTDKDVLPDDEKTHRLKELVGKVGVAKTPMLPSGAVVIDGMTIDAVSQGMAIEAGCKVVVQETKGNRVVVRPIDQNDQNDQQAAKDAGDLLSQPLDALGLENPDDPLA